MFAKIITFCLILSMALKAQDRMPVLIADIDGQKKIRLSRRAVLEER